MYNKKKHEDLKDCVGIRISIASNEYYWVVDDSSYNKGFGDALWVLSIDKSERDKYKPVTIKKYFKILKFLDFYIPNKK